MAIEFITYDTKTDFSIDQNFAELVNLEVASYREYANNDSLMIWKSFCELENNIFDNIINQQIYCLLAVDWKAAWFWKWIINLENNNIFESYFVYTWKEYRGKWYGKILLENQIQYAIKHACTKRWTTVRSDNYAALNLLKNSWYPFEYKKLWYTDGINECSLSL